MGNKLRLLYLNQLLQESKLQRVKNYFCKEGVDITLTVTPCWCYGSETMDMNQKYN